MARPDPGSNPQRPARRSPRSPAIAAQVTPLQLHDLLPEILVGIARRLDPVARKNFRCIAKKFRTAGAEAFQSVALGQRGDLMAALATFRPGGIRKLDLAGAQVTDADVSTIAQALGQQAPRLRHLNLSGNPALTGAGLADLPPLQRIDLDRCSGITNAQLQSLASQQQLQHLSLRECRQLTDPALAMLPSLPQLQHLDASRCNLLTGAGLASAAPLTALRHRTCRAAAASAAASFRR